MKRMILHWTSVLLASVALLSTSCSKDEEGGETEIPPVFPELQTLTIPAGETSCTITFTPNLDWTVSIPTDGDAAKWFELRDGELSVSSISGKASTTPVTVTVATSDQQEFDIAPVCEVSLTMGGQTQVIAKITRNTVAREFALYTSGYSVEDDNFTYIYSETPLTQYTEGMENPDDATIALQWPATVRSYMYVLKTQSNFEWLVSAPEWLTLAKKAEIEEEPGAYELRFEAQLTEENQDGATAVIDFYDANLDKDEDPGNNAHNKYCIKLPAFRDMIRFPYSDQGATFTFNADGKYVSESLGSDETLYDNLTTTVSSTKGLKFFVLVPDGYGGYYSYAANDRSNWVTIEDSWDENGEVFQQRNYTVTVAPNVEDERTADLLALPQTIAAGINESSSLDDQLLDTNGSFDLKEEYKPYIYASIKQEGAGGSQSGFSISPTSSCQHMFDNGSAKWEVIDKEDYFYEDDYLLNFGDEFMNGVPIYRLTYNTEGCEGGSIFLSIKGSFDYTFVGVTSEYLDAKWLYEEHWSDMPGETTMVVSMCANECETGVKGTIALYQGSQVVGRIVCVRNY